MQNRNAWEWVTFITPKGKIAVDRLDRYTVTLLSGNRLAVRADCNRGAGTFVAADHRITITRFSATRAMCAPGSHFDRFIRELGRVGSFAAFKGDLLLEPPTTPEAYASAKARQQERDDVLMPGPELTFPVDLD